MHVWTHLGPKWEGKSGFGLFADGMMELDWVVGELLKKLDDLGVAKDTIVVFTSDNGAEAFTWPDGGTVPFKGEKGTTWEGGVRVPGLVRWPGVVKPGTIYNDIMNPLTRANAHPNPTNAVPINDFPQQRCASECSRKSGCLPGVSGGI